jgi:cytochrome P450
VELNPFSYAFHENPYPTYRWLRDHAPVYHNRTLGFYALSRYADVLAASVDHGTYSSAKGTVLEMDQRTVEAAPMIIFMDPPRQTRLRRLVSGAFTPRRIAALEPTIRRLSVAYVDRMLEAGRCDYIRDFAALLPIEVISTMIGVPTADRTQIREWTDQALARDPDTPAVPAAALEAHAQLFQYFGSLLDERRARPRDDMASLLLAAEFENERGDRERLTDVEIVAFLNLLAAAGNETVTKLLGNAVVLLSRHPAARRRIVADPARIPNAVEEILRYWPPSQYQGRTTTRAVELHGRVIPSDARVLLLTGSACRDEREYDAPDVFDIDREIPVALAFGHGAHKCLGAALARLESRVGLEELHRRAPDYEVDENRLERVHMSNVHGFAAVPMRLR